jgi:hypothetical protein
MPKNWSWKRYSKIEEMKEICLVLQ